MVLSRISTSTLVYVAAGGGIFVASFGHYVRDSIIRRQAVRKFYQDAIRAARRDKGVLHLLGEGFIDQGWKNQKLLLEGTWQGEREGEDPGI